MYFDEHPECKEYNKSFPVVKDKKPVVCHPKLPPVRRLTDTSFIPDEIMQQTMKCYEQNNLFLYLANHLGYESALRLMKTYHVGTARKWKNATVFWQTDISGKIRTGKIMQYNAETGKRIKEPYAHVSWVHTELDIPEFHLQQCYFGEHLLYNSRKPVAIVESEKTAIIASFYIPEYIWLATGGKNGCFNEQNFGVLKGRNIVLFPVILNMLFTFRHIQAIFYCQFPAYSVVSYAVIAVAYGFSVIVHTVYHKMYMRMFSVVMPYNNILCVFDIHLFHIFPGNLYHKIVSQFP